MLRAIKKSRAEYNFLKINGVSNDNKEFKAQSMVFSDILHKRPLKQFGFKNFNAGQEAGSLNDCRTGISTGEFNF